MANDEQEGKAMLRGFVVISLLVFSVSVLSASADMWMDDFSGDKLDERWKPTISIDNAKPPADWEVENGILKGHWPYQGLQLLLIEYPYQNYAVQVKCRIDKQRSVENAVGFIFHSYGPDHKPTAWRGASELSSFGLGTASGGRSGWIRVGSDWWDTPFEVVGKGYTEGEWYTVKLLVNGADFEGYIDDELIVKEHDDKFNGSFVGLLIAHNTDASFDNFMVGDQEDFEMLDQGNVTGVSPEGMLITTWSGLKKQ
jgi:hypothetical protein